MEWDLKNLRRDVDTMRERLGQLVLVDMNRRQSPRRLHWRPWTSEMSLYYLHTYTGCIRWIVAESPGAARQSLIDEAAVVLAPRVLLAGEADVVRYRAVPEDKQPSWLAIRGYGSLGHGAGAEELEWNLRQMRTDTGLTSAYVNDTYSLSTQRHHVPNVAGREESAEGKSTSGGAWAPPS